MDGIGHNLDGIDATRARHMAHFAPRFGFEPASRHGLRCPYDAPDEAFMVVPLMPGHLAGLAGTVEYHAAFAPIEGSAQ